jgi:hypothetical protein
MRMPILGYGEDSLTLHALAAGLADILHQLGDDSDPERSVVFFRPSFGRKGPGTYGPAGAQFGEFDTIIGTPKAVYLGEANFRAMRWFSMRHSSAVIGYFAHVSKSTAGNLATTGLNLKPE